ncbi:MAG: DeoR/GlpR family DNA-binding transcription regulator [Armatimonadota bacterium]
MSISHLPGYQHPDDLRTMDLPSVRLRKLMALLRERGALRLGDVIDVFGTARATAQRDLERLCREYGAVRTRGGVMLPAGEEVTAIEYSVRQQAIPEAKALIARLAARRLPAGGTLFLDAGTTLLAFARELARSERRPGWVVTNSWHVAEVLSLAGIRHELLGGEVDAHSLAISGPTALAALANYHFDWAIISTDAITAAGDLRVARPPEAQLKRTAVQVSAQTMLLAHAAKFPGNAHAGVTDLDAVACWVSETAGAEMASLCRAHDVELITGDGEVRNGCR